MFSAFFFGGTGAEEGVTSAGTRGAGGTRKLRAVMSYNHGVKINETDTGAQAISTVSGSVIGIVGTAPEADAETFPLGAPVMVAGSRSKAAKLGAAGTLLSALNHIFAQAGAQVIVVRVEDAGDGEEAQTKANVIKGAEALLSAEAATGYVPRLLIAPGFSQDKAVADALVSAAEKLFAAAFADCPGTTPEEAFAYKEQFGSDRLMLLFPQATHFDAETAKDALAPLSPLAAGLQVKVDSEKGFWWSLSNQTLNGITGTSPLIDFRNGDATCTANMLNEKQISTVIRRDGFRFWGSRTCASGSTFAFLPVRRTSDMINLSIQDACLEFIDRPICKATLDAVVDSVNAYLRTLVSQGAILGGECFVDEDMNPASELAQGKVRFSYKFTPPAPMEDMQFDSATVTDYYDAVFSA